jgi:hypothetical protein
MAEEEGVRNGRDRWQKTAKLFIKNRSSLVSLVTHPLRLKIPHRRSSLPSFPAHARVTGATPRPDRASLRRPRAPRLLLVLVLLLLAWAV